MKLSRKTIIITVVLATLLVGVGIYAGQQNKKSDPVANPQSTEQGNDQNQISNTPTAQSQDNNQNQPLTQLAKPTLSKSSGNNASIPANILVQFTCSGVVDVSCKLILVNSDNPANQLSLDQKTIKDDGRGGAFVTWDWTSQPGTWKVSAVVSKEGYQSTSSNEQILTVRQP